MKNILRRIRHLVLRKGKPWNERYSVGRGTYGNPTVVDYGDGATLRVGAYCSIAIRVHFLLGGNHRTNWITTFPFPAFCKQEKSTTPFSFAKGDIVVGNDVWIGHDATILSGVSIGDGAVIGACAVVTKDVPPYGIVAGNPARLLKKRFTDEQIAILLGLKWWDWSEEKINRAMPLLLSSDLPGLVKFAESESISR